MGSFLGGKILHGILIGFQSVSCHQAFFARARGVNIHQLYCHLNQSFCYFERKQSRETDRDTERWHSLPVICSLSLYPPLPGCRTIWKSFCTPGVLALEHWEVRMDGKVGKHRPFWLWQSWNLPISVNYRLWAAHQCLQPLNFAQCASIKTSLTPLSLLSVSCVFLDSVVAFLWFPWVKFLGGFIYRGLYVVSVM